MGLMYLFERMSLVLFQLRTAHFHLTWDLQLTWALVSLVLHCDCIVTYWVFQKVATFVLEICLCAVLVLWCDTSEPVNCSILVSGCWHLAVCLPQESFALVRLPKCLSGSSHASQEVTSPCAPHGFANGNPSSPQLLAAAHSNR